ncbi:MAG: 50S ribosomal protein L25 [Bacteroidales bacterium]|jgi:large subunit ribosomal protein L25|nr:50S ribosomal protein L25 [Bacteroidales bacterium]
MKSVSMSGSLRENVGKKDAKAQRAQGLIPCVIYGGKEQLQFVVEEEQFQHLLFTPDVKFVELEVSGKKFEAVVQATQWHPITDHLLHVDFLEVTEGKSIVIGIPVKLTGTSPGVLRGGKLVKKIRKITVKGLLKNIPEEIIVDISNLDINDMIKVGDLSIPNLTFVENLNTLIVNIASTRNVVETQ